MDRTHLLVASALADAVEAIVVREGMDEARRAVEASGKRRGDLLIRWICVPNGPTETLLPCSDVPTLGDSRTFTVAGAHGERRVTVVPVRADETLRGAIEVSESPDFERDWAEDHFWAALRLALLSVASMALFAFVLGWWLVARPTRALVNKARAIGKGNLAPDLNLPTGDEFEHLADEVNAMCTELEHSRLAAVKATQAREAALQHLRHADRLASVGRMASGLAHELGTPLNVIEARASLIAADAAADEPTRNSATVIVEQTEHMTRLVKQLLVFARPRAAVPSALSLDTVGRTVCELVAPLAARKGVALDVAGLQPVLAAGDDVLLQQAVTNLTVNALHACAPKGHIWLSSGAKEAMAPGEGETRRFATLTVRDDGVGISEEHQQTIFEPFFSTKPSSEGTGLGLPIVSSIVEEHRGFLMLESTLGRGSSFTIYLPEHHP